VMCRPTLGWPTKPLRVFALASVAYVLEEVLQSGFVLLAFSFEHSCQDGRSQPG